MSNTKDNDNSMQKLGRAGESLVANYYNSVGRQVSLSIDQFDSTKDMTIDGKHVEVKTQVPFITKNAFTIRPNQLKKCLNSSMIIFVSVPSMKKSHSSDGKVYEISPENMKYYETSVAGGRKMVLIPIDQPSMVCLFEMSDKEKQILQRYSISEWNKSG